MQKNKTTGQFNKITRHKVNSFLQIRKLKYFLNAVSFSHRLFQRNNIGIAITYLNVTKRRKLFLDVLVYAERLGIDIDILRGCYIDGQKSLMDTIDDFCDNSYLKAFILEWIVRELEQLLSSKESKPYADSFMNKLNDFAQIFSINHIEKEILTLLYLKETDSIVESIINDLCDEMHLSGLFSGKINLEKPVSILCGMQKIAVRRALSNDGNLHKFGVISEDYGLPRHIIDFLNGLDKRPLIAQFYSEFKGHAIPLSKLSVSNVDKNTLELISRSRDINRGLNILLYGTAGTGKTEFARSLGRHLKHDIYEINTLSDDVRLPHDSAYFRIQAFLACQRTVNPAKSVIIIDEADDLLNTEQSIFGMLRQNADKGQLNQLLDESRTFNIWIVNRWDGLVESTRRRFDYSIEFKSFSFNQRRDIWLSQLKTHHIRQYINNNEIDQLASGFESSAGAITIAVRNTAAILRNNETCAMPAVEIIKNILNSHTNLLGDEAIHSGQPTNISPVYGLDGLNIDINPHAVIKRCAVFNRNWSDNTGTDIRNLNILLYGPPGTGKTEFARYLAGHLHRRLVQYQANDLLNPYVGMTERLIHQAFDQAERDQAVLFIDEADTFMGSRERAHHHWEISQVNEFLTNMEKYRGMLICATNFRQIVDSAAIRRFNLKMKFDYLTPDGNVIFFDRMLGRLVSRNLSPDEGDELRDIRFLTPGDFKVVYQQYAISDETNIEPFILIEALRREVSLKNEKVNRIGF